MASLTFFVFPTTRLLNFQDISDDWTAGAETECLGNALGVYNPTCVDGLKALDGCAYIQEFKRPFLWDFDHAQCFTG